MFSFKNLIWKVTFMLSYNMAVKMNLKNERAWLDPILSDIQEIG